MVAECDQEVPQHVMERLKQVDGIGKVTYLGMMGDE